MSFANFTTGQSHSFGGEYLKLGPNQLLRYIAAVPAASFRLLAGEQNLRDYQFGNKAIHRMFCAQCGVRPFLRGGDGEGDEFYAVRVNCLDGVDPRGLINAPVKYFDMQHDDFKSVPAETWHL